MKYGREEEDWEVLTHAGVGFLVERARLGKATSYTEMNTALARRSGLQAFVFEEQSDRTAMGYLLGLISEAPQLGFMLTSLVNYLDANDAGPGFYALAQERGLLRRGASRNEREAFWIEQMNAAHDHYGGAT